MNQQIRSTNKAYCLTLTLSRPQGSADCLPPEETVSRRR